MNSTSSKAKSRNFFRQIQEAETRFKSLGLSRPQDSYPGLLQRTRQINFGVINCENHPLRNEIDCWEPSHLMLTGDTSDCSKLNPKMKAVWIRTEEEFNGMMEKLWDCLEVSIDVECHNHRSLNGYIALIQIGTYAVNYLVDPFGLREEISTDLKQFFESPNHLKVGHAIVNDNLWLQRDFDIFLQACNDTQVMWEVFSGKHQVSLSNLMEHFFPESVNVKNKQLTISDWRLRPGSGMTWEQEQYAIADVHYTLRIFDRLRYLINQKPGDLLLRTFTITKEKLLKISPDLRPKTKSSEQSAIEELNKCLKNPKLRQMALKVKNEAESVRRFIHLFEWRQQISKIIDDKPDLTLSTKNLLQLATTEATADEVKAICDSEVHPTVWEKSSAKPKQAGIISNILTDHSFIDCLRTFECHNCLKIGHGPAWACPFPKNKENYKIWMNRPENRKIKNRQNDRRLDNLSKKIGVEKALKAVSGGT